MSSLRSCLAVFGALVLAAAVADAWAPHHHAQKAYYRPWGHGYGHSHGHAKGHYGSWGKKYVSYSRPVYTSYSRPSYGHSYGRPSYGQSRPSFGHSSFAHQSQGIHGRPSHFSHGSMGLSQGSHVVSGPIGSQVSTGPAIPGDVVGTGAPVVNPDPTQGVDFTDLERTPDDDVQTLPVVPPIPGQSVGGGFGGPGIGGLGVGDSFDSSPSATDFVSGVDGLPSDSDIGAALRRFRRF